MIWLHCILTFTGLPPDYFHFSEQAVCINITRPGMCHLQQRRKESTGTWDTALHTFSPLLLLSHAIFTHLWLQVTPLSVRLLGQELLLPLTVPQFSFPVSTTAELSPKVINPAYAFCSSFTFPGRMMNSFSALENDCCFIHVLCVSFWITTIDLHKLFWSAWKFWDVQDLWVVWCVYVHVVFRCQVNCKYQSFFFFFKHASKIASYVALFFGNPVYPEW